LMKIVATSPSCALQVKLFGESGCRIDLAQDLHTRRRQDLAFGSLSRTEPNVLTWDPLPIVYNNRAWLDVVDDSGHYTMYDWNHLSHAEAMRLAAPLATFFESVGRGLAR